MWDKDDAMSIIPFDVVDEFIYDYNERPGQNPRLVTIYGVRDEPTSRSEIYYLLLA